MTSSSLAYSFPKESDDIYVKLKRKRAKVDDLVKELEAKRSRCDELAKEMDAIHERIHTLKMLGMKAAIERSSALEEAARSAKISKTQRDLWEKRGQYDSAIADRCKFELMLDTDIEK